jgi:hypothetical protein
MAIGYAATADEHAMEGENTELSAHEALPITKRTPIDIPPSARELKARFWSEPERATVLEIAKYISETGEAHSHPDVTYGPIPKEADVLFLEVFSLVERFQYDVDHWCVCAACPHDLPQFKNNGVVCWVPEEGTIKIVGWDCFKARNPEAHRKAAERYNEQQRSRRDEAYLLTRLFHVPVLLRDLDDDIVIAEAFEVVRALFHKALIELGLDDLRRHIHYGRLCLDRRRRGGITGTVEYATVAGYQFLDRTGGAFSTRLGKVRRVLTELDFGTSWQETVFAMDAKQKARTVERLGTSIKAWTRVRDELDRMRPFIQPATGRMIERWSMEPETTFPMFFEYTEAGIRIGHSKLRNTLIEISQEARAPFSVLPETGPTLKS